MDGWTQTLQENASLLIAVVIQYRLARKTLGEKYAWFYTFFIMLAVNIFASWLNVSLGFATTIIENSFYYGVYNLALYLILFQGSVVKKVFLTVLITCGLPIPFYILLPFAQYFFSPQTDTFLLVLTVIQYLNLTLSAVGMEYVGKKFQNLRQELPQGYTIYLTGVVLFVYVAIFSAYDHMMLVNRFQLTLPSVLTAAAFALTGTALVGIAIFAVDRQVYLSLKEQLHIIQTEHFKSRELEWRRVAGFRHDIKNHLICLQNLLEHEKTEQAACYMRLLTDTVKQFDHAVQTGNDYADALLSVKYTEALAANIAVSIDMAIPAQGFIDPVDLCCILSNAFDNAIAACRGLPDGDKWITARAFIKQGQLIIAIKNSKPPHVTVVDGEVVPKAISADHGLGLDTVKAVVKQYGGVMQISADEVFSFSVLLPQLRL